MGPSSVYIFPISDGDDQDEKSVVMDFVDHSVSADTNTPGWATREFLASRRARISGKLSDRVNDEGLRLTVKFRELFLRYSQNLNCIGHLP